MSKAMIKLNPDLLIEVLTGLYLVYGSSDGEARAVAQHLVMADMSGHPSHGSGLTPLYLAGIEHGTLVPNRTAKRVSATGDFLLFDGANGYGQAVGLQVCDAVERQVKKRGVAVFGLRNVHHLGRLGDYAEYLADRGIISATFTNVASRPMVSSFRGSGPVLGTNPICIGIPRQDAASILLDFATSAIAIGKVRVALESGKQAPEGALIDGEGRPTRDPSVMYPEPGQKQGALVPMAAHKGAGLNLICELLAACINGATMDVKYVQGMIMNNMVGMAFSENVTGGTAASLEAAVLNYAASPMQEGQTLKLPGDAEYESRENLRLAGVPMPEATWDAIVKLGVAKGMAEADLRVAEQGQ